MSAIVFSANINIESILIVEGDAAVPHMSSMGASMANLPQLLSSTYSRPLQMRAMPERHCSYLRGPGIPEQAKTPH